MAVLTPQTAVYTVPVGAPVRVVAGDNTSFIAQAGSTGTILLEFSYDGVNFTTFATSGTGVAVSLNSKTLGLGQLGIIRATASTVAGTLLAMDVSQGGYYAANGALLLNTGTLYTTPNATTASTAISLKIPTGILKPNFRLELDVFYSLAGAGGTKTFIVNFGNTGSTTAAYSPTAVASGTANGRITALLVGANDGATVNCYGNIYAAAAIAATQAQITSNATYLTAEQDLNLTITKGTGTDTATLTAASVKLYQ